MRLTHLNGPRVPIMLCACPGGINLVVANRRGLGLGGINRENNSLRVLQGSRKMQLEQPGCLSVAMGKGQWTIQNTVLMLKNGRHLEFFAGDSFTSILQPKSLVASKI